MPSLTLYVAPPPLGGSSVTTNFTPSSARFTQAWGAQPGSATVAYDPGTVADGSIQTSGVQIGSEVRILTSVGHRFWGTVRSDVARSSSSGRERTLACVDLSDFLAWDVVFGAFNMVERAPVAQSNGRVHYPRRFWHVYPADISAGRKTYSTSPLSAATIIGLILGAGTVRAPWAHLGHSGLTVPVYDLDWTGGKSLDAALSEIGERAGLTFCHWGRDALGADAKWMLRWARKGTLESGDTIPVSVGGAFPTAADDCVDGYHLADNPSAVYVVGDRNRRQLLNVPLTPDWPEAWNVFFDPAAWTRWVFQHCWDPADATHTVFANRVDAGDPEQIIARQLALALASSITVAELAAYDPAFTDTRRFAGVSRMGLPVIVYIQRVLFRVFRLPDTLTVAPGTTLATESVRVADELLCAVTHDPATGAMAYDDGESLDGNGYAIVQGYAAGQDFFERMSPQRFVLQTWLDQADVWRAIPFQWDTSEDGSRRTAVFESAMYRSENLFYEVAGGSIVRRAGATYAAPSIRVSCVIEGERFSLAVQNPGMVGRVAVISEPALYETTLYDPNPANPQILTLPYEDGQTAVQKASALATAALSLERVTRVGGFSRPLVDGVAAQALNGQIDRISVTLEPSSGLTETVDFTTERGRGWEPVRDYARRQRARELAPGVSELRSTARKHRLLAAGLRTMPQMLRTLYAEWGPVGTTAVNWVPLANTPAP